MGHQNALRQAIVFVFFSFFFCEESLVRNTNLHHKDCSEMHLVVVITHYANVLFAIRTTDENYIEQQQRFLVVLIVFGKTISCVYRSVCSYLQCPLLQMYYNDCVLPHT